MTARLSRRLAGALRTIRVDPDCRSATVGRREVTGADLPSLRQQLAAAIYDELHAGRQPLDVPPGWSLRDPAVEARLRDVLPHRETARDVRVLDLGQELALVRLDGVRVWVPRTAIAARQGPVRAGSVATVLVPAWRAALSPGFFLADGTRPCPAKEPIVRVYVHLITAEAAHDVWHAVHGLLAEIGIGYRAKVVSWPPMLPRRDGLVVYLAERDREVARGIAAVARRVAGVGPISSVFAEPLAPGVAIAWEPADPRPGMAGLSFGEHRAIALADGLVRYAKRCADGAPASVHDSVRCAFTQAGIDPGNPARNLPPQP
jgi:HopA1 effector protein family